MKGSIPGLGDGQDVTDSDEIDEPKDIVSGRSEKPHFLDKYSNRSLSEEDHARIKNFCRDLSEDEDEVPAVKKFRHSEENFEPLGQQSNDQPFQENVIMDDDEDPNDLEVIEILSTDPSGSDLDEIQMIGGSAENITKEVPGESDVKIDPIKLQEMWDSMKQRYFEKPPEQRRKGRSNVRTRSRTMYNDYKYFISQDPHRKVKSPTLSTSMTQQEFKDAIDQWNLSVKCVVFDVKIKESYKNEPIENQPKPPVKEDFANLKEYLKAATSYNDQMKTFKKESTMLKKSLVRNINTKTLQ